MSLTSSGVILNLLVVGSLGRGRRRGPNMLGGVWGGGVLSTWRWMGHVHLCCLISDSWSCVSLAYILHYIRLNPPALFMCWTIGDNYPRAGKESLIAGNWPETYPLLVFCAICSYIMFIVAAGNWGICHSNCYAAANFVIDLFLLFSVVLVGY